MLGDKMAEHEEADRADGTDETQANLKRLDFKKQSLDDAYAAPANLLEIEVCNAETHGFARNRYTDYEIKMRVSLHGAYYMWEAVVLNLCVNTSLTL